MRIISQYEINTILGSIKEDLTTDLKRAPTDDEYKAELQKAFDEYGVDKRQVRRILSRLFGKE